MKSLLEKGFVYTPAAKHQTAEYLRDKFKAIRAEIEANKQEAEAKVSTIKPKLRAKA